MQKNVFDRNKKSAQRCELLGTLIVISKKEFESITLLVDFDKFQFQKLKLR